MKMRDNTMVRFLGWLLAMALAGVPLSFAGTVLAGDCVHTGHPLHLASVDNSPVVHPANAPPAHQPCCCDNGCSDTTCKSQCNVLHSILALPESAATGNAALFSLCTFRPVHRLTGLMHSPLLHPPC